MVLQALIDQGVTDIFGYPGGAVLPIYDEIVQQEKVRHILVRPRAGRRPRCRGLRPLDRQARRRAGHFRSRRHQHGDAAHRRPHGFDPDRLLHPGRCRPTSSATTPSRRPTPSASRGPCTKHNWLVRDVNDLSRIIHEAFYVAMHGRPGPVLVDIPKDVQFATGTYTPPEKVEHKTYHPRVQGRRARHPRRRRADRQGEEADLLHRRRRHQFRPQGDGAAPRIRACHRLSDHLHPDGPSAPIRQPIRSGSACSACTACTRPTTPCTTAT